MGVQSRPFCFAKEIPRLPNTVASEHRRTFLKGLGGLLGATALSRRWPAGRSADHVVIVGGGVLGASLAYHLSRRGAQITLLEKEAPAAGATSRSFAWINADFSKQPLDYHTFNKLGVWAHHLLQQELPRLPVEWGGCLQWHVDIVRAERLRRQLRQLEAWGYDVRSVSEAEFHSLARTGFSPGKHSRGLFRGAGGICEPHGVDRDAAYEGAGGWPQKLSIPAKSRVWTSRLAESDRSRRPRASTLPES
jgi:hypothetical protein